MRHGTRMMMVSALAVVSLTSCNGKSSPTTPTPVTQVPTPVPTPVPPPGTTPVVTAYVQDVKPILDADCVRCHGAGRASAGVDVSTYQSTMRIVTPGSAASALVRSTQPGGSMAGYLSGDRATKAAVIQRWVVDNRALESRSGSAASHAARLLAGEPVTGTAAVLASRPVCGRLSVWSCGVCTAELLT